jgi:hypothetical protein
MKDLIRSEGVENRIFLIRGQKVMFDRDLAELYDIETRALNKAVSRNIDRFPDDFMFQLNEDEFRNLKFHFGTSSWGGTRKLPRVFTEQGIAMLSSVLKSKRAIQVNIIIMRIFVKIRQLLSTHKEILAKLNELEQKTEKNKQKTDKNTADIQLIFNAIREMLAQPAPKTKRIGFLVDQ